MVDPHVLSTYYKMCVFPKFNLGGPESFLTLKQRFLFGLGFFVKIENEIIILAP